MTAKPTEQPRETASVWLQVRVRPSEKARWEALARSQGLTLSKYVIRKLNEENRND